MTGVASPMLRYAPARAAQFLLGLTGGALIAAVVVGLAIYGVGIPLSLLASHSVRTIALVILICALAAADLLNRTPHVWRQVPQVLIRRRLPTGLLGLVWGVDMGLLFTTQKVVSLLWGALGAALLLDPMAGFTVMLTAAALSSTSIMLWTLGGGRGITRYGTRQERKWSRHMRTVSGLILLAMAAMTAMQVYPA
jgi:hypothetical protein